MGDEPTQGEATLSAGDEAAGAGAAKARLGEGLSTLLSRAGRIRDAALQQVQTRSVALRHALAARERGNLEAAFWLLTEEVENGEGSPEVELAFWEVAVELGRPARAAEAAVSLARRHVASGDLELALLCWIELVRSVPEQLTPPSTLVALLPALRERISTTRGEEHANALQIFRTALRQAVDPRNEAPSPGQALRIFEAARDHHPESARRAAELALESPSLHEAKRGRLTAYLESVESAGEAGDGRQNPDEAPRELQEDPTEDADDPAAPRARMKVLEARPIDLGDTELEVETCGRRTRVAFSAIEGISAVRIDADAGNDPSGRPGGRVLVDLIMNLSLRAAEPLRVLRMCADEMDLDALGGDLETFLCELMSRASAVPLPDPESAMGLRLATFASVTDYERELSERA